MKTYKKAKRIIQQQKRVWQNGRIKSMYVDKYVNEIQILQLESKECYSAFLEKN